MDQATTNLKESQVHFKIFIKIEHDSNIDHIYTKLIEHTEALSSTYIWNNEAFLPSKPVKSSSDQHDQIYTSQGVCDYGDNIEDEWFIVYILHTLTLKYPGMLVTQVNDSDGEFLLIHAANFLPTWAQSAGDDCMKNRVFLHNGQLHMIPPASNPSQITYLPSAGPITSDLHAIKCVLDFPKLTCALPNIQASINQKLNTFASDLNRACFHRTTCIIPAKLAWLLNHNHSLISAAVNRFCDKDPDDLKKCRFLNHFKPTDLVSYRVQFTKHLYGKLKYADYKADKRQEWPQVEALMEQNLGPNIKFESYSDSTPARMDSKNLTALVRERSLLGLKLTCAFEILISNILGSGSSEDTKSFEKYVERLGKLGYFKGYMENSVKWCELMEKARESFLIHENISDTPSSKQSEKQPSTIPSEPPATQKPQPLEAKDAIKTNSTNYAVKLLESVYLDNQPSTESFSKLKSEIIKDQDLGEDDKDDWLCVEAPQLDDYLEMYSRGEVSSTYDFSIISNAFKSFLQTPKEDKDLLEGAEYNSIDKTNENAPGELIDFDIASIEKNLKDLLSTKAEGDSEVDNNDDENDSFYEIDDDLLEETTGDLKENLQSYMSSMDTELTSNKDLSRLESNNEELDLDLNLVSNALESYSSQLGCTGPVSNILKSLGL